MAYCIEIEFMGEVWIVDFNYSAGTNRLITSASLEPNDPESLEIEEFRHENLGLSGEFIGAFYDANQEAIEALVWDHINN